MYNSFEDIDNVDEICWRIQRISGAELSIVKRFYGIDCYPLPLSDMCHTLNMTRRQFYVHLSGVLEKLK